MWPNVWGLYVEVLELFINCNVWKVCYVLPLPFKLYLLANAKFMTRICVVKMYT